jgi:ABC-type amino acid transport system permease subunit
MQLNCAIYSKNIIPSMLNEVLKMLEASAVSSVIQLVFFLEFLLVIYQNFMANTR